MMAQVPKLILGNYEASPVFVLAMSNVALTATVVR